MEAREIEFKKNDEKNDGDTPPPSRKSKTTSEVIFSPFNDLCVFRIVTVSPLAALRRTIRKCDRRFCAKIDPRARGRIAAQGELW
jgi:hypothetical protein